VIDGAEVGADPFDGFSPIKTGEEVRIEGGDKAGVVRIETAFSFFLTHGEGFSGFREVIVFELVVDGGEEGRKRLKEIDIAADMVGR
jgi:hypothetical protein